MLRGSAAGATQTHEAPVGSYQPTILKLIVIKLSRHKRYYLLIPYSIFPIEENVSSIIDKFKFSLAKRKFGLGLIRTKLENTTKSSILLAIIAMNVDRLTSLLIRWLFWVLFGKPFAAAC